MIFLFLSAFFSLALAADIDRAPSGAVVTVRPGPTEHAAVVDASNRVLPLSIPSNLWLVNPDSWRMAVACGVEREELRKVAEERSALISLCQRERDETLQTRDACLAQYDVLSVERNTALEDIDRLKRQRPRLVLVSAAGGLVLGVLAVIGVGMAL